MPSEYSHLNEVGPSLGAARQIVPIVLKLLPQVRSVVDIGGGTGAWASVFRQKGIERVLVVDDESALPHFMLSTEEFRACNLEIALPDLSGYDLAVCLECAEHLDPSRAPELVECLTNASDVILFSAAIPGQGGNGHINEQPPAYWAKLFAARGFVRHDVVRQEILAIPAIPFWYRQNILIYAKEGIAISSRSILPADCEIVYDGILIGYRELGLRVILKGFFPALLRVIRRRTRWLWSSR